MAYNRTLNHFTSMQELATIWASSTSYLLNQPVIHNNFLYRCAVAHTSAGTFQTDLAAGRWSRVSSAENGINWAASTYYVLDQLVINNNKLYKCLVAHTSAALFETDIGAARWAEIATANSGVKNYIQNGDFENNTTTGWTLRRTTLNATTKVPNQAAGSWTSAAGTLSMSIESTVELAGSYSLRLASSGATTAGDMLVTDAITLDLEAQASVQTFSFFYDIISGGAPTNSNFSGTLNNSIGVAIYVVDGTLAGTWIQPSGAFNIVQTSGVGKAAGTFQVPSDATQVRLAVYFPNATVGAITVILDDFVLGPQVVQYGAPVTDWQSYTPTFTGFGTPTNVAMYWRRSGDSIEIKGRFTSGSSTATEARVSFPSGLTSDSAKISTIEICGAGEINTIGSLGQNIGVSYAVLSEPSVGYVTFSARSSGNTGLSKLTGNSILSSGSILTFFAQIPILGWSSTVQMSNDTDTRVVAARYYATASLGTLTGTTTAIYPVKEIDTHSSYNTATGIYTVPVSGVYKLFCQFRCDSTSSASYARIYKNGALLAEGGLFPATSLASPSVTSIVQCNAGDTLNFAGASGGTAVSVTGSSNYMSIERLSGPSAIAASETVAARYSTAAGQAITGAALTVVNFATIDYDSHGAVTTGASWRFTAPISGKYRVTSVLASGATTSSAGNRWFIQIHKNGSVTPHQRIGARRFDAALSTNVDINGSGSINLLAGEYIDLRVDSSLASMSLATDAGSNWIAIERIGN